MPIIHFLNVKEGDCSIIEHNSGRVTVMDVCNAKPRDMIEQITVRLANRGDFGNFNQKEYPVNPIAYLQDQNISSVFRFILTHPDMDHMDGIKAFFEKFQPCNFWDIDNHDDKEFGEGSPYNEEDWAFYKSMRDGKPQSDPRRLTLFSGATNPYFNMGENGEGGDGLHILAPTPELCRNANETGDYNDCSYVVLYMTGNRRILFAGDSHDKTWEHILSEHKQLVTNIDLLIAPHHGRKSGRSYEFLDVLKPKLTFFGNANSDYLAYSAWKHRELPLITNNQAGCMIVHIDSSSGAMSLYVTHKPFAEKINPATTHSDPFKAYYCCPIP